MKIRMKILKRLAFITIACLFAFSPVKAQFDMHEYNGDLIENLNKKLGVRLPAEYESKVKDFLKIISDGDGPNIDLEGDGPLTEFVEQFIIDQMKQDWKISKQNQLLFLWSDIYNVFRKKDLIDIYEADEQTLKDLEDVVDKLISLEEPIKAAMHKRIEEFNQESERLRERTRASLTRSLNILKEYYTLYQQHPDDEEYKQFKTKLDEIMPIIIEVELDYKKILTPEIRKFYGIE